MLRRIDALLGTVPDKYLIGLDCIVLANEASFPRKDRRGKTRSRKRKYDKSRILGRYHPAWRGNRPWIEVRVDKTLAANPRILLWIPAFRDFALAAVVFHELGHHIHYFIRPEYKEKEDVADDWRNKLMGNFLRKKYWYLVWPFVLRGKIRKWMVARRLKAEG